MPIAQPKILIDPKVDHVQGNLSAPIVLLEYGDYECPFCGEAHGVVKELQKRFDEQMCFAFRNFPLTEIHPHAELAAETAESAGRQNKFWEMHNTLFENQGALEEEDILRYAQEIGLDMEQFQKDLASGVMHERVQRDFILGLKEGVNGTPTFFVNGVRYNGSYRELEQVFYDILHA